MDNNIQLEQITNFILQNNNNKFSIQAFLKKIILEGINLTDDNIVYLAEEFGGRIDVETLVFIKEIYDKLIGNDICLLKDETKIDNLTNDVIHKNTNNDVYDNLTPKTIAIKHQIRNKKSNAAIDTNSLHRRIITVNNEKDIDNLLQQYLELSKTNKEPFYIHFNDGVHSSFFMAYRGKFVFIDSANQECILFQEDTDNNTLQSLITGSQIIKIQSDVSCCYMYTGLCMVVLDEYIKKYEIDNLEELGGVVEFNEEERKILKNIIITPVPLFKS